jgi:hypothetical protein
MDFFGELSNLIDQGIETPADLQHELDLEQKKQEENQDSDSEYLDKENFDTTTPADASASSGADGIIIQF